MKYKMVHLLSLVVASNMAAVAYCGLELDAKLGRRWTHETGETANYVLGSEALVTVGTSLSNLPLSLSADLGAVRQDAASSSTLQPGSRTSSAFGYEFTGSVKVWAPSKLLLDTIGTETIVPFLKVGYVFVADYSEKANNVNTNDFTTTEFNNVGEKGRGFRFSVGSKVSLGQAFGLTGEYGYSRLDLQSKGEMQTTVSNVTGNRVDISRRTMKSIHSVLVGAEMTL